MPGRNIANYDTFNDIAGRYIELRSSEEALVLYSANTNNPVFSFDMKTETLTVAGTLSVTGSAYFEDIKISEFEAGMHYLASNNAGNALDLGLYAKYNDGVEKYTGIIKDASDGRWTFFKDITTAPGTTVADIDSTKLDNVRMSRLFVNDGTAGAPSITFHNDTGANTGLFLAAQDEVGITAGGLKVAGLRYISPTSTEIQLDATTALRFLKLGTVDDVAGAAPGINIANIYLASESANDKWFKLYSNTTAPAPSYSGVVMTSPTTNYFLTNTGSNLEILYNSAVSSVSSPPDYRNGTTAQVMIVRSTNIESKVQMRHIAGSAAAPSVAFAGNENTGIFLNSANTTGISANGVLRVSVNTTTLTTTLPVRAPDGTVSAPAYSFTSIPGSGMWRNSADLYENITFSVNGTAVGKFHIRTTPQWITGAAGTAAIPALAFSNDLFSGLFSPTNEAASNQVAIATNTQEITRFRPRTGTGNGDIELYNKMMITPNGTVQKFHVSETQTTTTNKFRASRACFNGYNLIDANLLTLFTFRNDGAITKDYSNNAFDAVAIGSLTTIQTSKDGANKIKRDVLNLTANPGRALNLSAALATLATFNNTTISFWFRITGALGADNTIFSCYNPVGPKEISVKILSDADTYANAIQVTVESDALTTLQYHTATAADAGTPNIISVKDDLWHHVVIMFGSAAGSPNPKYFMFYDGEELSIANNSIYVTSNGDNVNPALSTNSFNDLTFTSVLIGCRDAAPTPTQVFNGLLKDIYITGKLLSVADITTLYEDPTIYAYGIDAAFMRVSELTVGNFSINVSSFADGNAAAPAIAFTSQSNLGVYRAAAGVLGFAAGGVEAATISTGSFTYNQGSFEVNNAARYLRLRYLSGSNGPRIVFSNTGGTPSQHSIRSIHDIAAATGNHLDFYLYDTGANDSDGLGNNQVMRLSVSAAAANSAIQTIYGVSRAFNGTVSNPAFAFSNSPGSGMYRIGADDIGFASAGVLKLRINSVITIGNASGDTTTRLYAPLGSNTLPSYSFIGDDNSGMYSSAADHIDFATGGASRLTINNSLITTPLTFAVDTTNAYINSTSSDAASTAQVGGFRITTPASRSAGIQWLFTADATRGFYMGTRYSGSSIAEFCIQSSTSAYSGAGSAAPANELLRLNFDTGQWRLKLGSASAPIYTFIGDENSGMFSSTADNIDFATAGVNRFNISTAQLNALLPIAGVVGTVSAPAYSFAGDLTTGILRDSAGVIGFTTANSLSLQISTAAINAIKPIQLSNGTAAAPSLQFNTDPDTGVYLFGSDSVGISTGNQDSWRFSRRGTAAHLSLNELQVSPDGSNVRLYVRDAVLRASSNQTVLNITPVLHYKFASNITSTTTQDESISKFAILSTTASYITSQISLTDASGMGLLNYRAAQFTTAGNDRIETAGNFTPLTLLSSFVIMVKFKLTSTTTGSLFEIYGNKAGSTSINFIRVSINSQNVVFNAFYGAVVISAATTSTPLLVDTWYSLVLTLNGAGNSITLNDATLSLTYSNGTGATAFNPSGFTSTGNPVVILGGNTASALGYFAEFYIAPTLTTETATALYRTQAHELYTNKIQLGHVGLSDEGCIIRSDKGNNLIWDNSLQIYPSAVQLNGSKVLRISSGTAANPGIGFIASPNSGVFSSGAGVVNVSAGGTNAVSITSSLITFNVPFQSSSGFSRRVSTITGTSATLSGSDNVILCSYATDATNVIITLPSAAASIGREYTIIKTGNGGGSVIINTASGTEYIDDATTTSHPLTVVYSKITLIACENNRWYST